MPGKTIRSRAIGSPSPCCAPVGGIFTADPHSDCFFCSKCNKLYTLDEVLDDVLDTAAKPQPSSKGKPSISVDDDDDVLNVTTKYTPNPPKGVPKPKMVPLSRTLQTYNVKEELKALGARWDHINRQWMIPESAFRAAHLVIQRGPKQVAPPPVTGAPFTASKFAGLDTDDLTFEEFNQLSWKDYNALLREGRDAAPPPPRPAVVKRVCWECAKPSSEAEYVAKRGVWDDYWCGCEGR